MDAARDPRRKRGGRSARSPLLPVQPRHCPPTNMYVCPVAAAEAPTAGAGKGGGKPKGGAEALAPVEGPFRPPPRSGHTLTRMHSGVLRVQGGPPPQLESSLMLPETCQYCLDRSESTNQSRKVLAVPMSSTSMQTGFH